MIESPGEPIELSKLVAECQMTCERIWQLLDDLEWTETGHTHLAGACFQIVLEHFAAVITLASQPASPVASIAALLRPQMEAYHRGMWLAYLADDEEVERFLKKKTGPNIGDIIERLECSGFFDSGSMTNVKKQTWQELCGFTHSGIELLVLYITEEGVGQNFSQRDISAMLETSRGWALMAAIGVGAISGNQTVVDELLSLARDI